MKFTPELTELYFGKIMCMYDWCGVCVFVCLCGVSVCLCVYVSWLTVYCLFYVCVLFMFMFMSAIQWVNSGSNDGHIYEHHV